MYTIERTDYDDIRTYWTGNTWSTDRHEYADLEQARADTLRIVQMGQHYGDPLVLKSNGATVLEY